MAELEQNIIPYGVQDFADLRRSGLYYVDKTPFIRELELRSRKVFFVRPRRMGKSLFVDMLARYYDLAGKDDFQKLFGGLSIGARPTENASSFAVLKLDFSLVNTGAGQTLEERFDLYMKIRLLDFVSRYADWLGGGLSAQMEALPANAVCEVVFARAAQKQLPIYVIIDEYDNFTNQMLKTESVEPYQSITHGDGFYREWFKKFKAGATRLFMTGVSPVTMDDLTSGFNVATNCSQDEGLNAMIGFTRDEVRKILTDFNGVGKCNIDVETTLAELERFYDGYCFSSYRLGEEPEAKESVFNSSMAFYYLQSLVVHGRPPDSMIDRNIRSDWNKLDYLLAIQRHLETFDGVLPLTEELAAGREVTFELVDAFQVKDIADEKNFKSLYYYYGIVTMSRMDRGYLYFKVPNECVRQQVLEYMRKQYAKLPDAMDLAELAHLHAAFSWDGDWKPFFDYIAQHFAKAWVNRDGLNGELLVNGYLRAYLMMRPAFMVRPEMEFGHRFSDYSLFPDRSLDAMRRAKCSYVIELKYSAKGESAAEVAAKRAEALVQLKAYSEDPALASLTAGTPTTYLYIHYQGFDQIACEAIDPVTGVTQS